MSAPARLLLASANSAKLAELRRILAAAGLAGLDVVGLTDIPAFPARPETGATFAENALAKARDAAHASGLPALADDSGLAVDALNGMPGVLSARWSGTRGSRAEVDKANLELLLHQVADIPDERLGATFVCAAALVRPDGRTFVTHGEWRGRLVRTPRGSNGFGYDSIFSPDRDGLTSAELSDAEKDAVSHRGRALRAMLPQLAALAG